LTITQFCGTANSKVNRTKTRTIGDACICSNFEQLRDDAAVADSGCDVQCSISRLVLCIDNFRHESTYAHGLHCGVTTEEVLLAIWSTALTDDKLQK
jgi:hypothetical protein